MLIVMKEHVSAAVWLIHKCSVLEVEVYGGIRVATQNFLVGSVHWCFCSFYFMTVVNKVKH